MFAWLTEVKFRRSLHKRFLGDLEEVRESWSPFVLVLVLASPPDEWSGEVRHIRAFEISDETHLTEKFLREESQRLQDVFARLKERWTKGSIVRMPEAVMRLVAQEEEQSDDELVRLGGAFEPSEAAS